MFGLGKGMYRDLRGMCRNLREWIYEDVRGK